MEDSFFFINDDALILGTAHKPENTVPMLARNNRWSRCTVSPGEWGHPIIAFPTKNKASDNTWDDIDIIGDFTSEAPVINIKGGYFKDILPGGSMINFTVRNVRVDSPRTGPLFRLYTDDNKNPGFIINNFVIENITATRILQTGSPLPEMDLYYNDSTEATQSITLHNIIIGGTTLTQSDLSKSSYYTVRSVDWPYIKITNPDPKHLKVTVSPNSSPTLNPIEPQTINEDAAPQTVQFSGITAGPTNASAQTLTVTARSDNPSLIPDPTVTYKSPDANGSLSYTPVLNANGTATITVSVSDGQATNATFRRQFTVRVNPVNDSPTLNPITNPAAINEDAGQQTVQLSGIGTGAANETQTLTVTASSDNTALIPNQAENLSVRYTSPNSTGSLSYKPVPNASGTATITVKVSDNQATNSTITRSFLVTLNAVNDLPTLNPIADQTISEDAGQQTVQLSGIGTGATNEFQTLRVTVRSSNPGLIPNPTVTYTSPNSIGSLLYTPVPKASGSATITVTVSDDLVANLSNSRTLTFKVTVNAVNPRTALNEWISGFNVGLSTGAADDFDHDGLDNAMEYLMGSDPTKPNTGLSVVKAGLNTLILNHNQSNTLALKLTKTYEWSTDLVNWYSSGQTNTNGTTVDIVANTKTDNIAPASDLIEVTYTISAGARGKLFARVKVGQF
jgi:hypothetical protein